MEITAAVLRSPSGRYELEHVELAGPGPGEVLVRIAGAGMCHTDVLPRVEGGPYAPPPCITGHEGAGVVEAIGEGVDGIAIGDHVVLSFDSCGECDNCRRGRPAYCDTFVLRNLIGRNVDGTTGVTDADGDEITSRWFGQSSFATHAISTARNTVVVDPALPLDRLGPLACGIQTGAGSVLVAMDVRPGSSIVVFGSGAVGLAAVMAAKAAGAETIIATDLEEHRRVLALELGATHVIDGADNDVVARVLDITQGGAGYAFDTTGVPDVMQHAIEATRMGGVIGFVGVQQGPLVLDGIGWVGKTIMNILEGGVDPQLFIPRMIELWQDGRFPFDRLIETFPLADINEAEQSSLSGGTVKPVLLPPA